MRLKTHAAQQHAKNTILQDMFHGFDLFLALGVIGIL